MLFAEESKPVIGLVLNSDPMHALPLALMKMRLVGGRISDLFKSSLREPQLDLFRCMVTNESRCVPIKRVAGPHFRIRVHGNSNSQGMNGHSKPSNQRQLAPHQPSFYPTNRN